MPTMGIITRKGMDGWGRKEVRGREGDADRCSDKEEAIGEVTAAHTYWSKAAAAAAQPWCIRVALEVAANK